MPRISKRGNYLPESPIRKLVPYAEQAKQKGRKVYHLNIGQPDVKTPEVSMNAVKNIAKNIIEYSHSAGYESYRRKFAAQYNQLGINISHEDLLITTGGSEAINFTFFSCLNPGEEVIIPEPFYTNYYGFAVSAGVSIKSVTSTIENNFALPPINEFEKQITPKTRAIMITNPNNPTGYLYSKEEMKQLRDLVKKHDLYLFSDEVYREFCYDGKPHISAMQLKGIEENVVLIDSISKRYNACGVRIGFLITKNREILNTALKLAQARLCPPGIGQIYGEASLDACSQYFTNVYNEYLERRNFIIGTLNKIEGVTAPVPGGAFYTVLKLPVNNAENFCKWLLTDFEYENQTVMLAPAAGFYATPGLGIDEARIAYVLNIEYLKKAVKCIEEALKVYPGRK